MLNNGAHIELSQPSQLSLSYSEQSCDGLVTDKLSVTRSTHNRHQSVTGPNAVNQIQNSEVVTDVTVVTDRLKDSKNEMSAAGVLVSTSSIQEVGRGSNPTAALQSLVVKPVPFVVARRIIEKHHYLHSLPGGTKLVFGVFINDRLKGAISFGAGPTNAYNLVYRAKPADCLVLTRLWLSDELPRNSESKVIAIVLRALKQHTTVKFLVSYADPSQRHVGTIYQATNWLYTGLSEPMPLYDLGDGIARQSRSLAHNFGTHSVKHLMGSGIDVNLIPQSSKHRYVYFLDSSWRPRLKPEILSYPRKTDINGSPNRQGRVWG